MSQVEPTRTRILYIEDDVVTAARVQIQLSLYDYVVDLAMDGKEGLAKLEKNLYDIVVVDYHLPGMNGLQILQHVVEGPKIPGIMVTGAGNERIAVEAMKLGAGDYLIKDIDNTYLELLPEVIKCELEQHKLFKEKQRAETALRERDTILETISFAAEKFLTCAHWGHPIKKVLARLGEAVRASRVYIFENCRDKKEQLLTSPRYEWAANGITPQIDNPHLQNCPYYPSQGRIAEKLSQGMPFYGLVKNFLPYEADIFESQDILSIAIIPVFVGKAWWGFIRFDDCLEEREWSSVVIDAFKTAANLLGAAIQDERMVQALRESEARLSESTQTLSAILNAATDSIVMTELDTTCVIINPAGAARLGRSVDELIAQRLCDLVAPKVATQRKKVFDQVIRTKQPTLFEDQEREGVWFEHSVYPVFDESHLVSRIAIVSRDISQRKRAEENLRLAATVFETTTEGIIITNAEHYIIMVNPAFTTITGYTSEEVVGKKPISLQSGHQNTQFDETMWKSLIETGKWQGELWNQRKNGEIYAEWKSIVVILDSDSQIIQYVTVFGDITKRKKAEKLIWHRAHYDTLTDIPNRALFSERLTQALCAAKRQQGQLAVMFIDLDRFKWVNDTLGHDAGDILLKEVANRLKASIREYDTVARLGGDEFTVILSPIENISDIKVIAMRILKTLSQPFTLNKQDAFIAGSIGIAIYPENGQDVETLLKNADMAMYEAKKGGRNTFRFFEKD